VVLDLGDSGGETVGDGSRRRGPLALFDRVRATVCACQPLTGISKPSSTGMSIFVKR
jgi:hypothetical protein